MKTIIALTILSVFLILAPDISTADDRDRHDRHYSKDRHQVTYQQVNHRDHNGRHDRYWKKQQYNKHDQYRSRHRPQRHVVYRDYPQRVVYRPAPTRVIYRQPVVYYPSAYLTVGVPNLNFHISW